LSDALTDQHSVGMNQITTSDARPDGRRPLVISSSLRLIDDVVRLASTVALEVQVAPDLTTAARHWLDAPLVIIGSDITGTTDLPGRRARVVVVDSGDGETSDADTARQRDMWRFAVEVGAEHVVELPDGERWLVESFRECAEGPIRDGRVTAVLGGSGGVGTSTFTVNLAVTANRRGSRSLVVDADPWGGGLDLVVGAEEMTGARWSDLRQVSGHLPAGHLDAALLRIGDVSVLSCSREDDVAGHSSAGIDTATMSSVLTAGRRSHDHVFVDCSRCSDEFLASILGSSHSAVLLAGDHVRATAAAARRFSWLRGKVSPLVVVQASSPRGIAREDIEHALGVDLAAVIPHVPSMTSRADEGELPALPRTYAAACESVLDIVMNGDRPSVRAA
jgi:secretion/DNA translocation related CpaE-like protein